MYLGKRQLDFFFSVIGIILFFPVWLIIGLLILLLDGRPIFFSQERVGRHRKAMTIKKFRTMTEGQKVTRTGNWIRKTGLDESLQFLSVLKGDMSLVGPRPITASDIVKLGWNVKRLKWRWHVRPGITGFAQLFEPLANANSLAKDRYLIKYGSPIGDLKILSMTFVFNIIGKQYGRKLFDRHPMNTIYKHKYQFDLSDK